MLSYRCYIFIVKRKIHLETIKALDYLLAAAALLIRTALGKLQEHVIDAHVMHRKITRFAATM